LECLDFVLQIFILLQERKHLGCLLLRALQVYPQRLNFFLRFNVTLFVGGKALSVMLYVLTVLSE